jgi:hypothetical protein
VGEYEPQPDTESLLHRNATNVYIKCDDSLIDILSFTEKHSFVRVDLPSRGTNMKIEVCSMSKVGQKCYSQLQIPIATLPQKFSRPVEVILPILIEGCTKPFTVEDCQRSQPGLKLTIICTDDPKKASQLLPKAPAKSSAPIQDRDLPIVYPKSIPQFLRIDKDIKNAL